MAAIDYLHPYIQKNYERDPDIEPPTLPDREVIAKAIIKDYTEILDNRIQEALEATHTSVHATNPDYQPIDTSAIAENVWEALNEMDDSPIGQIINGAIYGATKTASQIVDTTYNALASRYGEKLTTTINDVDSYNKLVDPIVEQLQTEIEVPNELTNTSRDAEYVANKIIDYLASYLSEKKPENEPLPEPNKTSQQQEIER